MKSTRRIFYPRLPLVTKIVAGFVVVIIFMVAASLTILLQLRPLLSSDQPEFRVLPLTEDLQRLSQAEVDIVRQYFETRSSVDQKKLDITTAQFRSLADSLLQIIDQPDGRRIALQVIDDHQRLEKFLAEQFDSMQSSRSFNVHAALHEYAVAADTIRVSVHTISEIYLPTLNRALKKLNQRISDSISGGYYILFLALAVGSVFAFLIARTVTRPLQALIQGTEHVAQGQYEPVPITSNDEIADLTGHFNDMSAKLKQLDEMRAQLMSEISHEMRTPLQVIKAGCYSIIHTKDGPSLTQRQRDAVGMIHQATNRINQFVNSFLDIAKMEAGLMKFNFESANLVDLLSPLVQEAQLIAQTRQINLQFSSDQIPPLMVDKERMGQVFSNLLSNALKYTPDAGTITVCIAKSSSCDGVGKTDRGCVRVDVQDTGVGIPESDLSKLFNKFYQAKNVPLVNEKGSGLGLALVKHVVEAHGGRVSVRSQVGVGSTFTILLPA